MPSKHFISIINHFLEDVAKDLEICVVVIIILQHSSGACLKGFQTVSELVLFYLKSYQSQNIEGAKCIWYIINEQTSG
jgi:hypothetical protein